MLYPEGGECERSQGLKEKVSQEGVSITVDEGAITTDVPYESIREDKDPCEINNIFTYNENVLVNGQVNVHANVYV